MSVNPDNQANISTLAGKVGAWLDKQDVHTQCRFDELLSEMEDAIADPEEATRTNFFRMSKIELGILIAHAVGQGAENAEKLANEYLGLTDPDHWK